jgi:hypothetical protein
VVRAELGKAQSQSELKKARSRRARMLVSPSEAAIEKRELLEEKGMDQAIEFLRQRAIDVRVVFLMRIA